MSEIVTIPDIMFLPKGNSIHDKIRYLLKGYCPDGLDESRNVNNYTAFDKDVIIYYDYVQEIYALKWRSSLEYLDLTAADIWARRQMNGLIITAPKSPNRESINFVLDLNADPRKIPQNVELAIKLDQRKIAEYANAIQAQINEKLDTLETLEQVTDAIYKIYAQQKATEIWVKTKRIKVIGSKIEAQQSEYVESRQKKADKEVKKSKSGKIEIRKSKKSGIESDPLYERFKDDTRRIKTFKAMGWKLNDLATHNKYNEMMGLPLITDLDDLKA